MAGQGFHGLIELGQVIHFSKAHDTQAWKVVSCHCNNRHLESRDAGDNREQTGRASACDTGNEA